LAENDRLKIAELFYSIQGESSFTGYPCFFIRLADCNLRCNYCDTRYTYEEDHPLMDISQIIKEAEKYPGAIVEVTGGEPLLQEGVYTLLEKLLSGGRTVLIETNGSISLRDVPEEVFKIMDIKCPGSGMHEHMVFDNFNFLSPKDEIKFVISSRDDYDWAVRLAREYNLQLLATITFSPVAKELSPKILAEWILQDQLPVRLQLQLHTILWPEKTRGH
jgi:7-carboxy-7-deazaguanine synthase